MKSTVYSIGFLMVAVIAGSCLRIDPPCTRSISSRLLDLLDQPRLQSDLDIIDKYLADNNQTAVKDPAGVRYTILKEGTGSTPCLESFISVSYTGKLLSTGSVFDSSVEPVEFQLSKLIPGWQLAFLNLKEGTRALIYIPSSLAYGSNARPNIPANSILVFEVDFKAIQ